jgi:hypothetical protein
MRWAILVEAAQEWSIVGYIDVRRSVDVPVNVDKMEDV